MDDRPAVADELARELTVDRATEELSGLDLLDEHERFRLRPRSRLVVALEGEEDDETEQHRESGRQHAEDSRGPVAVGEAAALGSAPPHEQHRGDRERDCHDDDDRRPTRFIESHAPAPARPPP